MLTTNDVVRYAEAAPDRPRPYGIAVVLGVAAGSALLTTLVQLHNLRILASWHGFLHTAIANRFPGPFQVPENPFFAGESLP